MLYFITQFLLTFFGITFLRFCLFLSIFESYQHCILFKPRKHKTFNYQPRFSNKNREDSVLNDENETTDFVSKWRESKGQKPKSRGVMPIKTLILVLILLLICMYLLEKKYM